MSDPGWIYGLRHPAWERLGLLKIGKTSRDPRTRGAEIASVSGLLAPCTIAFCLPVADLAAAELAVYRMLADKRVRKRRELFRADVAAAQQVVEAVARSQSRASFIAWATRRPAIPRPPVRRVSWRRGRPVSPAIRAFGGLAAALALLALLIRWVPAVWP